MQAAATCSWSWSAPSVLWNLCTLTKIPFMAHCSFLGFFLPAHHLLPISCWYSCAPGRGGPHSARSSVAYGFPCRRRAGDLRPATQSPQLTIPGFIFFCPVSPAPAVLLARQALKCSNRGSGNIPGPHSPKVHWSRNSSSRKLTRPLRGVKKQRARVSALSTF